MLLRCFTTRQPKSIARNSASLGARCVTTFKSAVVVTFRSRCCKRNDSAPTLRTSHGAAVAEFFNTWSSRKFFFFVRTASASSVKDGAMMTSLKISAMASAHGPSSGWFTAVALEPIAHVRTLGLIELVFVYLVSRRFFREKIAQREITGMVLLALGLAIVTRLDCDSRLTLYLFTRK